MRILPELVLSIFGMLIMVVDPLLDPKHSHQVAGHNRADRHSGRAGVGVLDGAVSRNRFLEHGSGGRLQRLLSLPGHRDCGGRHPQFFEYLAVQRIRAGEYYGLILFGTVGMC
jgi:hypothetical protein